jgi:hypothetical protein
VRGESDGEAKVDLNGHEAGNGRHSQGKPKAHCVLLYSEKTIAGRSFLKLCGLTWRMPVFATKMLRFAPAFAISPTARISWITKALWPLVCRPVPVRLRVPIAM